jgi:hypothetical protein
MNCMLHEPNTKSSMVHTRKLRGHEEYSKCHVTSNKAKSNLECAEEKFQTRGWGRGVGESERTSVKKLLPPQAMRGIWLGMQGLVRSYMTLSISTLDKIKCMVQNHSPWDTQGGKFLHSHLSSITHKLSISALQQWFWNGGTTMSINKMI